MGRRNVAVTRRDVRRPQNLSPPPPFEDDGDWPTLGSVPSPTRRQRQTRSEPGRQSTSPAARLSTPETSSGSPTQARSSLSESSLSPGPGSFADLFAGATKSTKPSPITEATSGSVGSASDLPIPIIKVEDTDAADGQDPPPETAPPIDRAADDVVKDDADIPTASLTQEAPSGGVSSSDLPVLKINDGEVLDRAPETSSPIDEAARIDADGSTVSPIQEAASNVVETFSDSPAPEAGDRDVIDGQVSPPDSASPIDEAAKNDEDNSTSSPTLESASDSVSSLGSPITEDNDSNATDDQDPAPKTASPIDETARNNADSLTSSPTHEEAKGVVGGIPALSTPEDNSDESKCHNLAPVPLTPLSSSSGVVQQQRRQLPRHTLRDLIVTLWGLTRNRCFICIQ